MVVHNEALTNVFHQKNTPHTHVLWHCFLGIGCNCCLALFLVFFWWNIFLFWLLLCMPLYNRNTLLGWLLWHYKGRRRMRVRDCIRSELRSLICFPGYFCVSSYNHACRLTLEPPPHISYPPRIWAQNFSTCRHQRITTKILETPKRMTVIQSVLLTVTTQAREPTTWARI